jgi:hypothetical protein
MAGLDARMAKEKELRGQAVINHVRTLLLNQPAGGAARVGDEYVPTGFGPRLVPAALLSVRRALFGPSPDRAMLNYRLHQYLALVHTCELVDYVLAKDPRITYWPFGDDIMRQVARGPVVTQVAGSPAVLTVMAAQAAVESHGRLRRQWQVNVVDGTSVQVVAHDDNGLVYTVVQTYTITDGLSNQLVLPDSSLRYRFQAGVGSVWQVDLASAPALSLPAVVMNLEALMSTAVREALFGTEPIEPYRTFRELWDSHDVLAYRLGAVVLALAYRMDEV